MTSDPGQPPPVGSGTGSFDFGRPFAFVFQDPSWVQKILLGTLFYLLGMIIIGWFFLLGYMARTVRAVAAGNDRLPEWDDLGDCFGEGLKLCVVAFVYALPLMLVVIGIAIPLGILEDSISEVMGGVISMGLVCVVVPFVLVLSVIVPAALLQVIMTGEFSKGFDLPGVFSFIRNNAGNYVMAVLVHIVGGFLAQFGIILCCVGVLATGFWSLLITSHAFGQVQRLSAPR